MSEQVDFALKSRAQPGDSAFLLNSGRHRLAFDPFPGRAIALAFLGSTEAPAAEAALARTFKAAPGTAIVFSASILHQVSRVTRGRRYVFLTFLFDEEAERVRQANLRAVQDAQRQPQLQVSV